MQGIRNSNIRQAVEAKIEPCPATGCWLWAGTVTSSGYGQLRVNRKLMQAHRVSWEAFKDRIPDGLMALHRCDVRCCVNPDHLFLGTNRDNIMDAVAKGRMNNWHSKKTHCSDGHEYVGYNLITYRGKRYCRTCKNARGSQHYHNRSK